MDERNQNNRTVDAPAAPTVSSQPDVKARPLGLFKLPLRPTPSLAEARATFKEILLSTKRKGIDRLISDLEEKTDFFVAPSSTEYHNAFEGGLLLHSLNVYYSLCNLIALWYDSFPNTMKPDQEVIDKLLASAPIVALLHDVCKTRFYEKYTKNVKVGPGPKDWAQEEHYRVRKDDGMFRYGHGEGSVFILMQYIKLTTTEAYAIRFHMGVFADRNDQNNCSAVYSTNTLAILLHMADEMSTFCYEKRGNESQQA